MKLRLYLCVDNSRLLYLILEEPLIQVVFIYFLAHVSDLFPVHLGHVSKEEGTLSYLR